MQVKLFLSQLLGSKSVKIICMDVKLLDVLDSAQIFISKSNFSFLQNPKAEGYLQEIYWPWNLCLCKCVCV